MYEPHRYEVFRLLQPAGWSWVCRTCNQGSPVSEFANEADADAAAQAHAASTKRVK